MARRRKQSILEDLMGMPWWVSVVIATIAYGGLRFVVPAVLAGSPIAAMLGQAAREHAWMFGLFLLIPAPIAAFRGYRRKILFDAQADLGSIRGLSWQEFEKLVAEAFHRMGYSVKEHGGSSPDGGIDLVATAPNEMVLVQCKHWRSQSVGVSIVREHYGVMTHKHATGGAIVVTGAFTPDAIAFAEGKPIQLIDGAKLETLILSVREDQPGRDRIEPDLQEMTCPDCNSPMVKRTAKKGALAGSTFWGSTKYPSCRGTRRAA